MSALKNQPRSRTLGHLITRCERLFQLELLQDRQLFELFVAFPGKWGRHALSISWPETSIAFSFG